MVLYVKTDNACAQIRMFIFVVLSAQCYVVTTQAANSELLLYVYLLV